MCQKGWQGFSSYCFLMSLKETGQKAGGSTSITAREDRRLGMSMRANEIQWQAPILCKRGPLERGALFGELAQRAMYSVTG